MKTFSIFWRDCVPSDFDFLLNTVENMEVKEFDVTGWRDFATGLKILDPRDEFILYVQDEEETAIRFRFGDKIRELV